MNAPAAPVPKPPKPKEEKYVSATRRGWPSKMKTHTSLEIVCGFSTMTTSLLKEYTGYKHLKDITVPACALAAITAAYQIEAEMLLSSLGYKEVLRFRGNGDSSLKFWIKDREGDVFAEVGPDVPDIKLSRTTETQWVRSGYYGFPSCCGAFIQIFLPSDTPVPTPRQSVGLSGVTCTSNLELSVVNCDDPYLGDFIYAGFFPIYKYSSPSGQCHYILAKPPQITTGAQMLVGDKSVDLQEVIEAFRKKAYKKD